MTGSTAAFACCTTWRTTCWAAGPATAPSSGDCRSESLPATASTSFLNSSAAEPGACRGGRGGGPARPRGPRRPRWPRRRRGPRRVLRRRARRRGLRRVLRQARRRARRRGPRRPRRPRRRHGPRRGPRRVPWRGSRRGPPGRRPPACRRSRRRPRSRCRRAGELFAHDGLLDCGWPPRRYPNGRRGFTGCAARAPDRAGSGCAARPRAGRRRRRCSGAARRAAGRHGGTARR